MIVGLGNIGLTYDVNREDITWTHTAAVLKDARYKLIAGVDVNRANREAFQSLTKQPSFNCVSDAIASISTSIDIVVIATPTSFHYSIYKEVKESASKIGCKLILIEKPVSDSNDEVNMMLADSKSGPKVWVNLFRLYQVQINKYLALFSKSGRCDISVIYSKGLLHNGIHFLSIILKHFEGDISIQKVGDDRVIKVGSDVVTVKFTPSINDLDNNSMILHSGIGSLYYLNGGRHSFYIDSNHCKNDFLEDEFSHYQSVVYGQMYKYLTNSEEKDDSLYLAAKSQTYLQLLENL